MWSAKFILCTLAVWMPVTMIGVWWFDQFAGEAADTPEADHFKVKAFVLVWLPIAAGMVLLALLP